MDWVRFFDQHSIDYITKGSSVARGNVAIHCPWCGDADQGYHLGIHLGGKGWGCWRNRAHRGKSATRLIQILLQCSYPEARRLAGERDAVVLESDETFGDRVKALVAKSVSGVPDRRSIRYPKEFKPVVDHGMGAMFVDYLMDRGYSARQALEVSRLYDLQYAVRGPFRYRLIIPVFMDSGLVNWTGRSIYQDAKVRYRTLSADPDKAREDGLPTAVTSIEQTLFNYGQLMDDSAEALVVVEGPLDAIRVDYLGAPLGIRGTCLFGTGNLSEHQISLLDSLVPQYRRRILLLDPDALMTQIGMTSRLEYLGFESRQVPPGVEDPARMSRADLEQIVD